MCDLTVNVKKVATKGRATNGPEDDSGHGPVIRACSTLCVLSLCVINPNVQMTKGTLSSDGDVFLK